MARGLELFLQPSHRLVEKRRGLLREITALFMQLGTQGAKRTSSTCKLFSVPFDGFEESKEALLWRTQRAQLLPERSKLFQPPLHYGFGEFFLGLEIVVNIAYRNMGSLGNVGKAGLSETALIRELHGCLNEPCPFVRFRFPHTPWPI